MDDELRKSYDAYVNQGLMLMLTAAKQGLFEEVITLESEETRVLDLAYNKFLLEAVAYRTQRAKELNETAQRNALLGYSLMGAALLWRQF